MIERGSVSGSGGEEDEEEGWFNVEGSDRTKDLWEGVTDITFKKFRIPYNRLAVRGPDHPIKFSVFSKIDDF